MRLRRLEPVLRRALRGPCRLPAGATLLVAVSGGADSTALLAALASVAHEFDLSLVAAHLHHGLRGPDADADEAHVRALCASLGVPLLAARWACALRLRRRGLRGEAGLRVLRREYLSTCARRMRAAAIATAHTADDQLETVLLRLGRGTGLQGLAGMRPRHGAWIKPLLEATRNDVERDLRRAGLSWREDATNAEATFARNRVRHAVVPALLDAIGAPAGPAAARRAGLARRASVAARELAEAARLLRAAGRRLFLRSVLGDEPGAVDPRLLAAAPLAVRRRVVRDLWRRACPTSSGLTRTRLDAVLALLDPARRQGRVELPGGHAAVRTAARFAFEVPTVSPARAAIHGRAVADARLRPVRTRRRNRHGSGDPRRALRRQDRHPEAKPVAPVTRVERR